MDAEKNDVNAAVETELSDLERMEAMLEEMLQNESKAIDRLKPNTVLEMSEARIIPLDNRPVSEIYGEPAETLPTPDKFERMWRKQVDLEKAVIANPEDDDLVRDLAISYIVIADVVQCIRKTFMENNNNSMTAVLVVIEYAIMNGIDNSTDIDSDSLTKEVLNGVVEEMNKRSADVVAAIGFDTFELLWEAVKVKDNA
jgi:hypothetical protein